MLLHERLENPLVHIRFEVGIVLRGTLQDDSFRGFGVCECVSEG